MTRFLTVLIVCAVCLPLLAMAGCGKKDKAGAQSRGPALTPYRQKPAEKLEPIEISPVMKEHKGVPPAGK